MIPIRSWGNLSLEPHDFRCLASVALAPSQVRNSPGLCMGLGRSYGDVALNPGGRLWSSSSLDHFIDFDEISGILTCEAGVSLREIQRLMVPRGWMLPVTPGTQYVTVGGAIANDVHGKNHHVHGTFGHHVRALRLLRTDGTVMDIDYSSVDWLKATIGGLGLTGIILTAQLQLMRVSSPWLLSETLPFYDLPTFLDLTQASESGWDYNVAWIDCARRGSPRGLFIRAQHTVHVAGTWTESSQNMPFTPPFSLVNRISLHAFNTVYFHAHAHSSKASTVHYQPFFYPLDRIQHWNRMYGPQGFYQYQCVVPLEAISTIQDMLETIASSSEGSFLAVLKSFGSRPSLGMLSFVRPGITLALDFPNRGRATLSLFEKLDDLLRHAGGALYMAKDARMPQDLFRAGYPSWPSFQRFRDPGISSSLSRRLMEW